MSKKKKSSDWPEAKKRCRLNQNDIQMAKELGMKPKSLLKNIPSPNQHWKAPVKIWIRNLYEDTFGVSETQKKKQHYTEKADNIADEELPF